MTRIGLIDRLPFIDIYMLAEPIEDTKRAKDELNRCLLQTLTRKQDEE